MKALLVLALCLSAPSFAWADNATAAEHYKKGTVLYDTGDYAGAAAEYLLAFQAKDDVALLYNIGQAQRLANHPDEALRAYRGYLRRAPRARNRAEVEQRITEMQELVDHPPPKPEPTPPPEPAPAPVVAPAPVAIAAPPPPPPKKPVYKKWWFWTAIAGGAVAVGLGVGLGVGLTRDQFDASLGTLRPTALTIRFGGAR